MSSSRRSRPSISKQRGAAMSSRLMPPKPGAIAFTIVMISSVSVVSRQIGQASIPANSLKSIALPSITGIAARRADVAQAEHGRPVGDDGDRVLLDREGPDLVGLGGDRQADPGDARRVGHREVVARLHRHLVLHLDLAAQVHEERAVGDVHDRDAGHVPDGIDDPLAVVGVGRRHRDVAHAALARDPHEVDRAEVAVGLADGCGDLRERPRHRRELDANGEAVGRGRVGGRHLAAKPIATGPDHPLRYASHGGDRQADPAEGPESRRRARQAVRRLPGRRERARVPRLLRAARGAPDRRGPSRRTRCSAWPTCSCGCSWTTGRARCSWRGTPSRPAGSRSPPTTRRTESRCPTSCASSSPGSSRWSRRSATAT